MNTRHDMPTSPGEAVEKAANDVGRFLKNEIDETSEKVAEGAKAVAPSTALLAVAGIAGFLGLELIVLSPVVAHPWRALGFGCGLLGVAGIVGVGAYRALPDEPRRMLDRQVEKVRGALP